MRSNKTRALLAAATMMTMMVGTSYAAPNITNIVTQSGGTLTITGSGFGTRQNYSLGQPFMNRAWHDFQNGQFKSGNFTYSDYPAPNNNWTMETTGNRPNRNYHIKKRSVNGQRGGSFGIYPSLSEARSSEYYWTFWMKLEAGSSPTGSGKFTRIWGNPTTNDNIYLSTGLTGSSYNTSIRGNSESTRTPCGGSCTQWGSPDSLGENVWHRVEIWMDDNPSTFTVWLDGKHQYTRTDWVPTNFDARNSNMWEIGGMWEGGGGYGFSDVYFDYTRARIELCNAPTWSNRTVCEIQIPTAWSDSSVSIRSNNGTFSNGATAYLFVVDAAGNTSSGYPITIGSTGTVNSLSPPQNLRIIISN